MQLANQLDQNRRLLLAHLKAASQRGWAVNLINEMSLGELQVRHLPPVKHDRCWQAGEPAECS